MPEPFLGEIRLFPFNFTSNHWVPCNGQQLEIVHFPALFSILSNKFGGDGKTTFAVPDLKDRVPLHMSSTYGWGEAGGANTHKLLMTEMPSHTHSVNGWSDDSETTLASPAAGFWSFAYSPYVKDAFSGVLPMNIKAISTVGLSEPHSNMQPFLAVNFYISVNGLYPIRS